MTALADLLKARIARSGPINVAEYMADCLMHPTHGYYATRDPFGCAGDFITAPEISQMFGELIGLSLAQAWLDQGSPKNIVLAELGPGRGTLMEDALRATKAVPGFHAALTVHFVEASPVLRKAQAEVVPDATWHDAASTLPEMPLYLIANEFFDALPLRQFIRTGDAWAEKMVGLEDDQLSFGLSTPAPLGLLEHRLSDTKQSDLIEHCPALPAIVQTIGDRIGRFGGAGLIVDYGDWDSLGDTLQAVKAHEFVDPLAAPGISDLTAHVDFAAIAQAATPARYTKLATQGLFLERLGITARAQSLAQNLSGPAKDTHIKAHRRLTHPAEMGDLFKVIGLYPDGASPPAGLEP